MLVIGAAVVIAIVLGIAYFAGYYKKKPGDKREGETLPQPGRES